MKKVITILTIAVLVLIALGIDASPVYAYAYGADFISVIHYQNLGTETAEITIQVYDSQGNPVGGSSDVATLAPYGATSLYAGTLTGLSDDFKGSAVIRSDQPLASVIAQVGPSSIKNQPLSNGFSEGAPSVKIPTVLKNMFYFHSVFSIQNVDSNPADLTLTFVTVEGEETYYSINNLAPSASYYIDMATFDGIEASTFNGSVAIDAVVSGTQEPGLIVATSMELEILGYNAYAFNGASTTSNAIYMPTACCRYYGSTSAYAVQNPTTEPISVKVIYSNGVVDGPYTLEPFAKRSFDGCRGGNPGGYLGSATVSSDSQILAVGKVYGGGLYPAHLGFMSGSDTIALPLVRWTEANWFNGTGQRTFIAVQNIGSESIAAGDVKAYYYDKEGQLVGIHELDAIGVGKKVNTWPYFLGEVGYEFGTYPDGSSGGSAVIVGPEGSQLAVVIRVEKYIGGRSAVGEDYVGIPFDGFVIP